jgi:hypothetical protein
MIRRLLFWAQGALAVAVVYFAWRTLATQWAAAREAGLSWHLVWGWVALSGGLVLLAYGLLIEAWRVVVTQWQGREQELLLFGTAARIWFISNLGRYVPGKVWQIASMGLLAQRAGISPLIATGSSILVNLVALTAGAGVVALTGSSLLAGAPLAWAAIVVAGVVILLAPRLTKLLARLASAMLNRQVSAPGIPERGTWLAALACAAAWILYGTAFWALARGVAIEAEGGVPLYIAAFTASYLLGYVTVIAPGGIVVREAALVALAAKFQLMSGGEALLLAVASRLWLTILELLPGAILLAMSAITAKNQRTNMSDDSA